MTVSISWLNSHTLNIVYNGLYDRDEALRAYLELLAEPRVGLRFVLVDFTECMLPSEDFDSIFAINDETLLASVASYLSTPSLEKIAFVMPANIPLRRWIESKLSSLEAQAEYAFFEAREEALKEINSENEPPATGT